MIKTLIPFVEWFECGTVLVSIVIDILIIIDSVIPVRHIACKQYQEEEGNI